MGRRLYWQDSYGHVHRDRDAERARETSRRGGSPGLMRAVVLVLAAMVVLIVLAQLASVH